MSAPRLLPLAALVLAACASDPMAPSPNLPAGEAAVTPNNATEPSVACTVEPFLTGYRAVVGWTRTPATMVSLRATGVASDQQLPKRTRNGSLAVQLTFIPTAVFVFARTKLSGSATCTFISS